MKFFISTLLLTWVFIPCGLAQAQTFTPELLQGSEITLNGKSYRLLGKVRSVKIPHCKAVENGPSQLESLGIEGDRFLTAKQNHALYETETAPDSLIVDTTAQGAKRHPIVYNPKNKNLFVVTGNLSVKLTKNNHASSLAQRHNLTIYRQFEHLRLVIFQVAETKDINKVANRLKRDKRVKRVQVELLANAPSVN